MDTNDLIRALNADTGRRSPLTRIWWLSAVVATVAAAIAC